MGADRQLIRWEPITGYLRDLAARSDRILYAEYGRDWGNQPLVLLTISSPRNLDRLDELRLIQDRLYDPRIASDASRASLVADGRCVCLITCSIHPTEIGPTQFAPELVYELLTRDDPATARILDELIILIVPSLNPSGHELVCDWYERTLNTPYEGSAPPLLYHPSAGHDNNRDWFMQALPETRATVQEVLNRWHPQIVFDLHQMQVNGPRVVLPPYIDPYDPHVDPLLQRQIDALGTAIAADLTAEGRQGVATSAIFDAYSPSRAYAHYHGGARILAEVASARLATPVDVPWDYLAEARGFDPQLATHNHPLPWPGGTWRTRDIIDCFRSATFSLLDHAARQRDRWVANFARIQERAVNVSQPAAFLILPLAYQRDPGVAAEMIETLQRGGIEVEQADRSFDAEGVEFPAETLIVRAGQPAGAFARTLLEIQHYPHLPLYPGGPPKPPYDITSHSLPLQMGVDTVRIESPFDVQPTPLTEAPRPIGGLRSSARSELYLVGPESNGAAMLVNQMLKRGARVARTVDAVILAERQYPAGSFLIEGIDSDIIHRQSIDTGVVSTGVAAPDLPDAWSLTAPRIGLYQSWRINAIDEGWTRLILEEHGFDVITLKDVDIKRGDLIEQFDVVILPQQSVRDLTDGNSLAEYPAEYAGGLGNTGAVSLRRFVEAGGTLIALDSACDFAIRHLYLPVANALDGVRPETFSAPGSMLRILVNCDHPIGWGFEREAAAMFVASPAFETRGHAQVVARYPKTNPLLSGWLHGEDQIAGRAAIVEVAVGLGQAILIGFRPQFRAQSRGTYRFLFNALYASTLERISAR